MAGLGLVVSGVNAEAIQKAVQRIKTFLDAVGAKYRYHDSGKSDSAYFHVREPAKVAEDPWNPDVVDARISDHDLPRFYDSPDLDVSVPKPRPKAISPDFAVKLLKDFLKGKIDIEEGEVIPVNASLGVRGKVLYPISSRSFILSKIVYHGTPNKVGDVGDFSTDFIGTGEGAIAYGWGLYFAENKGIANWYHKKMSKSLGVDLSLFGNPLGLNKDRSAIVLGGTKVLQKGNYVNNVWEFLTKNVFLQEDGAVVLDQYIRVLEFFINTLEEKGGKLRSVLRSEIKFNTIHPGGDGRFGLVLDIFPEIVRFASADRLLNCLRELLDSLRYWRKSKLCEDVKGTQGAGYVYEVDIKVPEEYFLDEDSNWHWQSEYVRGCLLNAPHNLIRKAVQRWVKARTVNGHHFLVSLYEMLGGGDSGFYNTDIAKKESLLLRECGVHGYRYLDASSREAGKGSRNYIIIDDNDIETVRHHAKDKETGQVDLFPDEMFVQPARKAIASFQRIVSAYRDGEGVSLTVLADLINATAADIHYIHFYAGGGGKWDRIHDVCSEYYLRLGEAYDDVAELCLQLDLDVTHPNDSAGAVGFQNAGGSLASPFEYESAMQILQDRLHNLTDVAAEVVGGYQGGDVDSVAVRNFLEGFIEEWSKEADFKLKGRLGGERDFGGSYRDRVTDDSVSGEEMITGDVEEDVF